MRLSMLIGLMGLILAGCTASASTLSPAPSGSAPTLPASTPSPSMIAPPPATLEAPPLTSGELLPEEPAPPGAEREFTTDFSRHSVPYSEILSGGPPKDGIPAIDGPEFVTVEDADEWLQPQEPVILVVMAEDARAYPLQILMWHEIVNDIIGEIPVTVTYCPLCNTGVAFERAFDDQTLDFGTTGRLRISNLVMYDRQTETWWQQATGEGIAGEYTGRRLTFVPASMIAWADFKASHPGGKVLSRDTGYARSYGRNPYVGYDDENESPYLFRGDTPELLPAMARVVTIDAEGEAVAYPYEVLQEVHVVNDIVAGEPVVVLWAPGTASALDASSVAGGDDVGAATTFSRHLDGQTLTFAFENGSIVDEQTGSEWDVLGQAVGGPLQGSALPPVVSINHFWFSWAAFRPETRVHGFEQPVAAVPPTESVAESSQLSADFEINVYQGEDALGGSSVKFSEVLAQGRPVVLALWAGLCPLCRAEMPHLEEAHLTYGSEILMVGVDIGPFVGLGSEEDAIALLDELKITFAAGSTPDATVVREYRVLGTPSTLFFTPTGELMQQWNGMLTEKQLSELIEALIEAST